jgi:Outer membrane protein beta-barrel domain
MESRMLKRCALGAVMGICSITSTCVTAAEASGFYAGFGLGETTNVAANPTRGEDFEDSAFSFRALGGYSFWKWLALEADYIYTGTTEGSFGPYDLELSSSTVIVTAVGTWPIGRWGLSMKLGYGYYDADQSIRLGNLKTSSSHADHDVAGGLAVSFRFNERYSLRAEYDAVLLDGGDFTNASLIGIYKF